ncbi:Isoquinoline 1-oxidoreductase [Candidatus Koribacter versatilis Ellin345]|uniref:Isoquinoline 1-oxidoreductase n=1 Tax=Koribacter versatilis (strain Ellin345) TaxID=204669 RepID=Q1IQB7_KORVE|nr:molybdopterin cofactor-binding domain-containing protein [Candidatus Koribacter versatilis]ABF40933.1 Isoquinoline 1-oxidoreductase [Candidatus Koribacter versatilis Ellin345]
MTSDALELELKQHDVNDKLHWFELDRRDFLRVFGGGMLICLSRVPGVAQESGRRGGGHELPKEVSAWLHIDADGKVTVNTGKIECGQNIRTSLAQQVAEELHVPVDSIAMIMGDTDLVPWDAGTFGSRSTPTMGPQLRTMAAAASAALIDLAAQRWGLSGDFTLSTLDGKITNPRTKETLTYGELTRGQQISRTVEGDPDLTPAIYWHVAGKPEIKVNGRDFVTGAHKYPSDIQRPGMMFGKVLRPSAYKATLASVNTTAAEKISGVKVVRDGDFVGVVAPDAHTAEQGLKALTAKWNEPQGPSNANIFEYLKTNLDGDPEAEGKPLDKVTANVNMARRYTLQYIAHAPLEPRAAVAEWNGDKLTVWTGTQRPFGVKDELVEAFHISPSNVRVIQPDMGSGYGGKHTGDAAIEAARLARAAGKPVRVVWTREEEFCWAYFRPAGAIEIRGSALNDGTLAYWEHHNYNSGPAAIGTPYESRDKSIVFHPVKSPLRQGSYRGLAAPGNNFARESVMDELAHELKMDPLAFRLKNLKNERLIAVSNAAAEKFGWANRRSTPELGQGFACGTDKGGYTAACAEVAIDPKTKKVKVRRVVQAWESGAVINPNGLRNQIEGAIVQAIGWALFEAILFSNSKIENPHFAQYRLPRFSDAPKIEIVLLDRKDLPSAGAGETGNNVLAPAIGNAIFAATGVRLRHLPMCPEREIPGVEAWPFKS